MAQIEPISPILILIGFHFDTPVILDTELDAPPGDQGHGQPLPSFNAEAVEIDIALSLDHA